MKKILLLLTGGTIGSESKNGIIGLKKEGSPLADLYMQYGRKDVNIQVKRVADILSENATVKDLANITNTLIEVQSYDGAVVAYGTDTFAYAVNFAAMALYNYPIPAVFVSSDKPLGEEGANGLDNFSAAIDFICDTGLNGVYACYKNPGEAPKIHLGSRILQAEAITGNFESATGLFLGKILNGKFIFNENNLEEIQKKKGGETAKLSGDPSVLYIKPCPSTDFRVFDTEKHKPVAVIAELYHSGTGSTEGERSLAAFIRRCKGQGVPVVLASYPYKDGRKYLTTKALEDAGGVFAYRMSAEAAYAKTLVYFMSNEKRSLKEFLEKDLFFETLN